MKYLHVLIAIFISLGSLSAQDVLFKTAIDTNYWINSSYLRESNRSGVIPKNYTLKLSKDNHFLFYTSKDEDAEIVFFSTLVDLNNQRVIVPMANLIPANSLDLLPEAMITLDITSPKRKFYVKPYYIDVLKSQDPKTLFKYEPFWNSQKWWPSDDGFGDEKYWHEWLSSSISGLHGPLTIITQSHLSLFDYTALIQSIQKIDKGYKIKVTFKDEQRYEGAWPINQPYFNMMGKRRTVDLLLIPDGDYIDIYLDSMSRKLDTIVMVDDTFINKFNELITMGLAVPVSVDGVTWPRRGTPAIMPSLETASPRPLGTPVSLYTTTSNLRLRDQASTAGTIVVTITKGSKVEVLQRGIKATIDGITAPWVQVKTADGTIGWCFGGYLDPQP